MPLPSGSFLLQNLSDGYGIYEYEYVNSSGQFVSQLWSQSGSTANLLATYNNVAGVQPEGTASGQYLYEVEVQPAGGTAYTQVFGTDGSVAGPQLLYTIPNYLGDSISAAANGYEFFAYSAASSSGESVVVFSTNGTTGGTNPLVSLTGGNGIGYATGAFVSNASGIAFEILENVEINTTVNYLTLIYQSDGTVAGTTLVATVPNTNGANFPQPLITPAATASTVAGQSVAISGLGVLYYTTAAAAPFTVQINAAGGILSTAANQGTVTGANTTAMVLSGSLAQVNADLAALTFTPTASGAGSLSVTASTNGTTSSTAVSAVLVAAAIPRVTITGTAGLTNQTGQTLSGTVDPVDAGAPITIRDGTTVVSTASANAAGQWTANVTVSAQGVHTLTAQATNGLGTGTSNAVTVLVSAATALSGGNQAVVFLGSADSVTLSASAGNWDTVIAGGGTVTLAAAQAAVTGAGVAINFTANTSGDVVGLYATGGTWDAVTGTNGTVYLTGAQASVTGSGNTISFAGGTGNVVGLYNTGGTWDSIWAPDNETIYLTSAQAAVAGGGNTISFAGGTGNVVGLYNTGGSWDSIWAPGSETIYLTSAQAAITGGGDTISFAGGTGNIAGLYNTGGTWDSIWAPGGETIYLTSAQAAITGGGNTISFAGGTGNVVGLYNTGGAADAIWAPGGDTIYFTSAQATVTGGGDSISFAGGSGNVATLQNTAGTADAVWASNGTINLANAQAAITGGGNAVAFTGTSTATLAGSNETLTFQHGIGGIEVFNGFATSDTLQFSASDFTNWAHLLGSGAIAQVGADTVITLDANDSVRLTNFSASSLTSAQVRFV